MGILIIISIIAILIIIFHLINNKMQNKKVQRKSNGSVRVYQSNRSYDYVDYPSFWHYENSSNYSPNETVHDVSSFDGFSDGDFGGGGSGGSYSDSGGGDGGGGGGGD